MDEQPKLTPAFPLTETATAKDLLSIRRAMESLQLQFRAGVIHLGRISQVGPIFGFEPDFQLIRALAAFQCNAIILEDAAAIGRIHDVHDELDRATAALQKIAGCRTGETTAAKFAACVLEQLGRGE